MKVTKRGSALILVLIVASASGLVLTSLSKYAVSEQKLNDGSRLIIEAKEAAEAAVECGFAQLVQRFQTRTSFPIDALSPDSGNPLVLTEDFFTLFQNGSGRMESSVLLPGYPYNPKAAWGTQTTEIIGGQVPPGEWKFIDGRIPGNEFDPLRDKLVFIREIEIFGKATIVNPANSYEYVSYVAQSLQVRDAPLFAHAVFYNMDMEIAPGPQMVIHGAVHANGEMYIQSNISLDFHKNVSATGRIYHGTSPRITKTVVDGAVTFTDGHGNQLSMNMGGNWIDSALTDFRSIASNRWNGNLQGYEHGIQDHNPVAIDPYVRDNPDTAQVDDPLNFAYQLIQPLRTKSDPNYVDDIETQKFHYKAGLVISVDTATDTLSAYTMEVDVNGVVQFEDGLPKKQPLVLESGVVEISRYSASGSDVNSGLYDQRMRQGINLVEVDVGELATLIESNDSSSWGGNESQAPSEWWNGIVYLEFDQVADPGRPDNVVPAVSGWGVKLKNGQTIPNPDFGWTKDLYGATIATNVPLYIHGNYNADGDPNTGSATAPDSSNVRVEPPAALIADAITVLSNSWDDSKSLKNTGSRKANSFTEVSAAFLTGLVPSNKSGWNNYSGGVENFPRFLESWNTKFRYRGSMVALFESEVATEPWGKSNVYDAPQRDWGFNSLFSKGYYPPGTPNSRTFRRVNYRNLSKSEYEQSLSHLATQI